MSNAFKLRNGTILLTTEAPGGIYNASQLKKIASLCEGETAIVKATEDQRLALCVDPEKASTIASELQAIGLGIRHYQDGLHHPTACIGELCPEHEQDALGAALDISQQLEEIKLQNPLKIGINGCARCCVPCHTLDISVVGDESGYRVHLGGKNSQLPEMASFMAEGVPASELPALTKKIVDLYKTHAQNGESLQAVIDRVGAGDFVAALAPYSQDAAGASDPFGTPSTINDVLTPSDELLTPAADFTSESSSDHIATESNAIIEHEDLAIAEDVSLEMTSAQLGPVDASLEAMEEFSSETEIPVTTSGIDHNGIDHNIDINPTLEAGDSFDTEISIAQPSSDALEISLSDDFGEDSLETSQPEAIANDGLALAALDLEEAAHSNALTPKDDTDLTELAIDAGDALKTTATTIKGADESTTQVDDLSFESIGTDAAEFTADTTPEELAIATSETLEATEAQFEQQLTASMDAQEQLLDVSETDENRAKELDLLGSSEPSLEESNMAVDNSAPMDDLSTMEDAALTSIGDEDSFEEIKLSPSLVAADTKDYSSTGHESADTSSHALDEHLPLSEIVDTTHKLEENHGFEDASAEPNEPKMTGHEWALNGVSMDANGNPVVSFSNGVQLTMTMSAVAAGSLIIGGHKIKLTEVDGGVEMTMDGMKLFLPRAA